jgi:hypothetical protein
MLCYGSIVPKSSGTKHGGARRGAGRPRELTEPVRITLSFERKELEELHAIGDATGHSLASIVREGARLMIRTHRRRKR